MPSKGPGPPSPASLLSISLTPVDPSIVAGTTTQLKATGTYSNNAKTDLTASVTWNSSNTAIATVDVHGLVSAALSTTGTTTISASYGGLSDSTVLTSSDLASIEVTPLNTDDSIQDLTTEVTWSSSIPTVAFISNVTGFQGLATAQGQGSTTITATLGSISGSTVLTVPPF